MKANRNGGRQSTVAGNNTLLHSDIIDFAMSPAQRLLARISSIVGCHVTSKQPMRARTFGEKFQLAGCLRGRGKTRLLPSVQIKPRMRYLELLHAS